MATKTDTVRRLRAGAALARKRLWVPANARVEVGLRVFNTSTLTAPTTWEEAHDLCYPEDDDLTDNVDFRSVAAELVDGAVVHLYVNERAGWDCELYDTVVVWLGYGAEEPRIIDTRFVEYAEEGDTE